MIAAPIEAQDKKPGTAVGIPAKPVLKAAEVSADEAAKLIAASKDLIILDVRTPEEFDHEHIKGAVNLNLFDIDFAKSVGALDQSKSVLIHCASGNRSRKALIALADKVKFPKVYHLTTGFVGWAKAGNPVERKPLPIKAAK